MAGETIQRLAVFLDELHDSGANITEIARALKELDLKIHRNLQRAALEKGDPRIIDYLKQEAPVFYDKFKFSTEVRIWMSQKK